MPNAKNKESLQSLKEKVAKAKSVIFTEYHGLNSNDINTLRDTVRGTDSEVAIAKNTLIKIALKENESTNVSGLDETLSGPTAIVLGYADALSPIKAVFEFVKKYELPKIKGGILDGRLSNAAELETLSKLPSREQLIARVVGGLKSPLNGLVGTLNGVQRKFVYALSAIAEKKS